jgi:hypothetical protein
MANAPKYPIWTGSAGYEPPGIKVTPEHLWNAIRNLIHTQEVIQMIKEDSAAMQKLMMEKEKDEKVLSKVMEELFGQGPWVTKEKTND